MITGGVLMQRKKGELANGKCCRSTSARGVRRGRTGSACPLRRMSKVPEGVRVALENGVDTIEHGAKPDEEILRLFRGAAQVATLPPWCRMPALTAA